MQEEFPRPFRFMIADISAGIGADIGVDKKKLAVFNPGVALLQISLSFPEGLYLRAGEDQPRLKFVLDMVLMKRLFISTNRFHSINYNT